MAEPVKEVNDAHAPAEEEIKRPLSREETLLLVESMKGMWNGQLEQYGGVEEFVRKLRSDEPLFS